MNALSSVFFEKRTAPLLVGSVKSNVGNTEASSSFVGITKSIIAMETGMIPPNINYSKPNPDVPALVNGQFVVNKLVNFFIIIWLGVSKLHYFFTVTLTQFT